MANYIYGRYVCKTVFDIKHIKGSTTPADLISRTVKRVDYCANDLDDDSILVRPLDAGFDQDLTTEAFTQSGYIHPHLMCATHGDDATVL